MATNRGIVEMVEKLRGESPPGEGNKEGLILAELVSISPVSIRVFGTVFSSGIYLNPLLRLPEYAMKAGDTVAVFISGDRFYILSREVPA